MMIISSTRNSRNPLNNLDVVSVFVYLILVVWGIMSIYSASYNVENPKPFYDFSSFAGKQFIFALTAIGLIILVFLLDYRLFEDFAYIFYALSILLLIAVVLFGKVVKGQQNWIQIGPVSMQPTEFAKLGVSLALARFLGAPGSKLTDKKIWLGIGIIFIIPALLILKQGDYGSLMVFVLLELALYREGMPFWVITLQIVIAILFVLSLLIKPVYLAFGLFFVFVAITGVMLLIRRKVERSEWIVLIAGFLLAAMFVVSVPKIFAKLKKYHQERIMVLLDEDAVDKKGGAYYNLQQSKIAIGSGGFWGKGFLEGTQTKYDFVPEQHSDFIFCTVGEEFGWAGSFLVIVLFMILLFRVVMIAERQRSRFARIYGYCVASIFFAHFAFNLSMTVGLFPTIGVPLPFMSYGGSSLWSFTLMLFILLKLDMHRNRLFSRD
ncbi:MAG: rod shape-determining protein RodA [Raineya sp.]|nr:rod shape-determining protein RodA [Raineya sp.]